MAQWSTGALVAVGLGAMFVGIGLGGRVMANYCVRVCPEILNRNQRQRRLYGGRSFAGGQGSAQRHEDTGWEYQRGYGVPIVWADPGR